MPYTVEDYREEVKRNVLNSLTPDEISDFLKKISPEQRLNGLSAKEIEAFMKKSKKKNKKS
ncbi:MAG: hypothetical protein GY795_33445 [Desulfobacterales bacterium]|nr:hypothetical protein [Desulfobacterales bacterium]